MTRTDDREYLRDMAERRSLDHKLVTPLDFVRVFGWWLNCPEGDDEALAELIALFGETGEGRRLHARDRREGWAA